MRIGSFELRRQIGKGGMSEVWLALHRSAPGAAPLPVALKVMTAEQARRRAFVSTFRNEVRAVAGLDHPGIVMLLDHGEVDAAGENSTGGRFSRGSPYLAMELAGCGALKKTGSIHWLELRVILLRLLDALAHAHARGVLHRDLKPGNILLAGPGDARPGLKITDFGLACPMELTADTPPGARAAGSPNYMAPEQLLGQWRDYGPWTDLFALGCVAYQLASGARPWPTGERHEVLDVRLGTPPQPLVPLSPLPAGFVEWLARLFEKNPLQRFQRAADASAALLQLGEPDRRAEDRIGRPLPFPAAVDAGCVARRALLPASERLPSITPPPLRLLGADLSLYPLRRIPLVGREHERERLWSLLRESDRTGEPRLVLLRGGAGQGKTRLAEWLAERTHELGAATVLRISHGAIAGPRDGVVPMLARHFRVQGLGRAEAAARIEKQLSAHGTTEAYEWETLAALVVHGRGSVPPASAPGALDEPSLGSPGERHALIARHLRRLSRDRLVLCWIDDVQWGSDALDLALHLLSSPEPARVLFVLTTRDEALVERPVEAAQVARLLGELPERTSELVLEPLDRPIQLELIRNLLSLEEPLAIQVAERTAGNPLFAVQLVGDWVQRRVLLAGAQGLRLAPGEAAALPDDLHAVWTDRVERLIEGADPRWRTALEIAAILGQRIELEEWRRALEHTEARGLELEPLVNALLATRLWVSSEGSFAFSHEMLRESLERTALEAGRAGGHHAACAAMLEARQVQGPPVLERLGGHLARSGEPRAALEALYLAGRKRLERGEVKLAQVIASRIEGLLSLLPDAAEPWAAELWLLLEEVARLSSRFGEAEQAALRAEQIGAGCGAASARARAMFARALIAQRVGRFARAQELHLLAREVFDGADDAIGAARCLRELGYVAQQCGDPDRAEQWLGEALERFRGAQDWLGVATVLQRAGLLARQRGDHRTAVRKYRGAMALFRRLGSQLGLADCHNGLGDSARFAGELAAAEQHYRESIALAQRAGSGTSVVPRLNLGLVELSRRRFESAREVLEALLADVERTGQRGLHGCALVALLPCYAANETWLRFDEARARARVLVRSTGMIDADLAWPLALAAELCERKGEPRRARAAHALAYRQYRALGVAQGQAEAAAGLGRSKAAGPGRFR